MRPRSLHYARLCALAENVGTQAWRATTKSIITGEVCLSGRPVRSVWSMLLNKGAGRWADGRRFQLPPPPPFGRPRLTLQAQQFPLVSIETWAWQGRER